MELHICGCRGSSPVVGAQFQEFGCATSCYVLREGDYAIVIDCGSGLYRAKSILSDCREIDVLLTHLHYDHLIGLLYGSAFPPGVTVRFFSDFDTWYGEKTLEKFLSPPFWPFTPTFAALHSVLPPAEVSLRRGVRAKFLSGAHPNGCVMIELSYSGKRICFVGDFEHGTVPLKPWTQNCDWLVYDGMYTREEYPAHVGWGHSSWEEGCNLAKNNQVGHLLITHHSPEYDDALLRTEEARAQQVFPDTCFARECAVFPL